MKKVRVEDAVGMELCHDLTCIRDGFKGPLFKRGHIVEEKDIKELLNIGKRTIFVWEESADEIHEEDCAKMMAQMTGIDNGHFTGPSEGKVVLIADMPGMFCVNRKLLQEINSIGDITISCLPNHYPVQAGARLASERIVPLVTKRAQMEEAGRLCKENDLFHLYPYQEKKVGIIITGSEIYHKRIPDKFEPVLKNKLQKYPATILGVQLCDDETEMIEAAAKDFLDRGADFLIFTGGMSVDPDDITPAAIKRIGAEIIRHGVPAQPGNMTLVAYQGDTVMVGVPGAAVSMPTTIFDVVLPQIFAGVKFTEDDLIHLGEGGLCQLCDGCHFPNCSFGRY